MLPAQSSTQGQHSWVDTPVPEQGLLIEPQLLIWHRVSHGASMPLLRLALSYRELVPKEARTGIGCSLSKVSATWWWIAP